MQPEANELDLHGFRPRDLGALLDEFLALATEHSWPEVRVVHGRGSLAMARSVHAILARHPLVESFSLATAPWGGHGATWVRLRPKKALGTMPPFPITKPCR